MARHSTGPRYYASKGMWVANLNGERIPLVRGPRKQTEERAHELYEDLTAQRRAELEGDRAPCWVVLAAYLRQAGTRTVPPPLAPSTLRMQAVAINSFGRLYGNVPVRDLKMSQVQEWLHQGRTVPRKCARTGRLTTWSETTVRNYLSTLHTAFAWAAGFGQLIGESPFTRRGITVPWPETDFSKGHLAMTEAEYLALRAQAARRAKKEFVLLLDLLWHTGCRPAEAHQARAAEWDDGVQGFVLDPSDPDNVGRLKTRRILKKRGRKRVVQVPDHLVPALKEQMAKRPEGPLFLTERGGKPWTKESFADRFKSLVLATNHNGGGVRPELTGYSARHAYATHWLLAGGDVMMLCEVMNTSLEMLRRTYSHIFEEHGSRLEAVNRFSAGRRAGRPESGSASAGGHGGAGG